MKVNQGLKHTFNILAAVLFSAVAIIFTVYGLTYQSLPFIREHYALLMSITTGVIFVLGLLYVILYLLNKQALYRLIFCALIFLDFCAVVFFAICATGFITKINSIQSLRDYISDFGSWAVVLYILFCFYFLAWLQFINLIL